MARRPIDPQYTRRAKLGRLGRSFTSGWAVFYGTILLSRGVTALTKPGTTSTDHGYATLLIAGYVLFVALVITTRIRRRRTRSRLSIATAHAADLHPQPPDSTAQPPSPDWYTQTWPNRHPSGSPTHRAP
jgi:hypothetical protein